MNRSTHPVEREEVMAYLDGELPTERAAHVAAHLEQCAECRGLAAELRLVSQQVAAWQVEPSPARLAERVTSALEEFDDERLPDHAAEARKSLRDSSERRRPLLPGWLWQLAGASALLLLLVAIAVPNLLRSRVAVDQAKLAAEQRMRDQAAPEPQGPANRQPVAPSARIAGRVSAAPEPPVGPMIIRTAALTIVTREFDNARAVTEQIVRQHQGYIAQLNTSGQSGAARTLTATLRFPADRLDAALAGLRKLGRVEQESQAADEVTQQYVDLVARLSNARNTEQRLIEVLRERTGKVADILAVEREISRVREEIERMDAQRKNLEAEVRFATVQLRLNEEHKAELQVAPASTSTLLWNGMVEGFRAAADGAIGLVLFILRYGPVSLLWFLVLFFPARFAWRRLRAAVQ